MSALSILALVWLAVGLLLVLNIESLIRRAISWGAWEHEPMFPWNIERSTLNVQRSKSPVIINALARTGALECPKPKLETQTRNPKL